MKQLIIMRHAKAQAQSDTGEDFDRPLSDRGHSEALLIAEALKTHGYRPDFGLISPALRTKQTFEALCTVLGPIEASFQERLYESDSSVLLAAVLERLAVPDTQTETVLLLAHNPGLQYLATELMIEAGASTSQIINMSQGFPTAQAVVFELDVAERFIYQTHFNPKDYH